MVLFCLVSWTSQVIIQLEEWGTMSLHDSEQNEVSESNLCFPSPHLCCPSPLRSAHSENGFTSMGTGKRQINGTRRVFKLLTQPKIEFLCMLSRRFRLLHMPILVRACAKWKDALAWRGFEPSTLSMGKMPWDWRSNQLIHHGSIC